MKPARLLGDLTDPNRLERLRFKLRLSSGAIVLAKINVGHTAELRRLARVLIERERTALTVLRDLAVPALVPMPPPALRSLVGRSTFSLVGTEWFPFPSCANRKLAPTTAIGVWLFALEQLVAFRRYGILYTDVKPQNVLLSRNLDRAAIIDFDYCTPVSRRGRYATSAFGFTLGYAAPEQIMAQTVDERCAVYQVGMLLANLLLGGFTNSERDSAKLERAYELLSRSHGPKLASLFRRSVSVELARRPRDLETLLRLGARPLETWERLRAPYSRILADLDLRGPG